MLHDALPEKMPDASPRASGDTSPGPRCDWCSGPLTDRRADARFCSRRCRQSAFRIRRRQLCEARAGLPMLFAYADPPYPGFARSLYDRDEVDHAELIASLQTGYDGWALSTGAYALRELLPLCPPSVRVAAWVKPIGVSSKTRGPHNAWEPVIVVPGRLMTPGKRDWIAAQPARGNGTLIGRKPEAFCVWLFNLLGMKAGDELRDLFPGTGIVGRCWAELSRPGVADAGVDDTTKGDRNGGSDSAV